MMNQPLHAKMQILVAEDNHANTLIIETVLERAGHQVVTARNGLQALKLTKLTSYDLIILDIRMPILNGIGALEKIRAEDSSNKDTLIFALTAYCGGQDRQNFLSAGFDAVLIKPLRTGDLESALKKFKPQNKWVSQLSDKTACANDIRLLDKDKVRDLSSQHTPKALLDMQSRLWTTIQDQCVRIKICLPAVLEGDELCISEFRRAVQAIKTVSASIGLVRVADICHRLRNAPRFEISLLMQAFIDALNESRPALAHALSGTGPLYGTGQLNPAVQMRRENEAKASHHGQDYGAAVGD